jgi:hypothetical protein
LRYSEKTTNYIKNIARRESIMRQYIKPSIELIELRPEERLAYSYSILGKVANGGVTIVDVFFTNNSTHGTEERLKFIPTKNFWEKLSEYISNMLSKHSNWS